MVWKCAFKKYGFSLVLLVLLTLFTGAYIKRTIDVARDK